MRLTELEDVDIALDEYGQPKTDNDGNVLTVSGDACWFQDVVCEALTQEGEMLHEDEEGRWAYGFGLLDFAHAAGEEDLQDDVYARVREKLTKREFIEPSSIQTRLDPPGADKERVLHISFSKIDETDERNIDIRVNNTEVEIG